MHRFTTWIRGLRVGDVLVGVLIGFMFGAAGSTEPEPASAPVEVRTERVTATETVTEPTDSTEVDALLAEVEDRDRLTALTRKITARDKKLDRR